MGPAAVLGSAEFPKVKGIGSGLVINKINVREACKDGQAGRPQASGEHYLPQMSRHELCEGRDQRAQQRHRQEACWWKAGGEASSDELV
ncbi:hypothetical protein E2C01_096865 [Portunus trituberculatus]|uniref:Uncharacterized protein n=1 Tax=Portunus trituberculatus TaxID=210409 RepID=A0A5B7K413_PORTR|nr:hypothetical protein [Portunus trituberculatus]